MTSPPAVRSDALLVALDLGGTWIKGTAWRENQPLPTSTSLTARRWPNPLAKTRTAGEYAAAILACIREMCTGHEARSVSISTAGEVGPSRKDYRLVAAHLTALTLTGWVDIVARELDCEVTLINDAEAFLIGAIRRPGISLSGRIAALAVGTGLGFAVLQDGRWWKPGRRVVTLGSIQTPSGNFDQWSSSVSAAERAGGDLAEIFFNAKFAEVRNDYLSGLASIVATATDLFHLDRIFIGGGLADAARDFPLASTLAGLAKPRVLESEKFPRIETVPEANLHTLAGTLALAAGMATGRKLEHSGDFATLETELSSSGDPIDGNPAEIIASRMARAERESAEVFETIAPRLGEQAALLKEKLSRGGRAICVGAGTSGRVAAMDAVEIPCTFGFPADRWVALVAGGCAEASFSIESEGEEDFSAVPELLPFRLGADDFVVGISASGTAFYVRSALAYARHCGAHTLLLHEGALDRADFFDAAIPLGSGAELVRGSTRLKAGTATKKALNILSTTAMVLLGNVRGSRMINLDVSNQKIASRASRILADTLGLTLPEAAAHLVACEGDMRRALASPPSAAQC